MTNMEDTLTICKKIKQLIQQHYKNLSSRQLAQKVHKQIIPILISLFFQPTQTTSMTNKILMENKTNIFNQLKSRLRQSYKYQTCRIGKENNQYHDKEYKEKLWKIGINLQEYLINNSDCRIQDIIMKTLSLCKIINILSKLSKNKQNTSEIFTIYRQTTAKKRKNIIWLSKYAQITTIRHCLHKFHRNLYQKSNNKQACKKLHTFYLHKLYNYFNKFTQNLSLTTNTLSSSYHHKQYLYRQLIFKSALNRVQNIYQRKLRMVMIKIKQYNLKTNPWLTKWVRIIAFRTPANLQTSFWRLKNFMSNQANPQDNKSLAKWQTQNKKARNRQFPKQTDWQTKIKSEQLFTKKQKTQILCGLLQMVYKQRYFFCLVEAFTAIQLCPCPSKEISSKQDENIIIDH